MTTPLDDMLDMDAVPLVSASEMAEMGRFASNLIYLQTTDVNGAHLVISAEQFLPLALVIQTGIETIRLGQQRSVK